MELNLKHIAQALNVSPVAAVPSDQPFIASGLPPLALWRGLLSAWSVNQTAILPDPGWPANWWNTLQKEALATPFKGEILIATSGSTGLPKWCRHTLGTLSTAALGFAEHYQPLNLLHSVVVLPQYHVGGLLPILRSAACGGRVHFADYRDTDSLVNVPFSLKEASLSLVPTQLERILQQPGGDHQLRKFGALFIGGAAASDDLLAKAFAHELPLAPCYGATETAAMVAAMSPEAFLKGAKGVGTVLPHARVTLTPEGMIQVFSQALFKGYLGQRDFSQKKGLILPDHGEWAPQGMLHILKRADHAYLSGGELVQPSTVESALREVLPGAKARCIGVDDPEWGQRIELVIEWPHEERPDPQDLMHQLKERLPPSAVPKRIHFRRDSLKS